MASTDQLLDTPATAGKPAQRLDPPQPAEPPAAPPDRMTPEDRALLERAAANATEKAPAPPPTPTPGIPHDLAAVMARTRAAIERNGGWAPPEPRETPEQLAARHRAERDQAWAAVVPRRFLDAHVEDLDSGVKTMAVEAWLEDTSRNLLLTGGVGTGKTWTACAAARTLHDAGRKIGFVSAGKWLAQLAPYGVDPVYEAATAATVLVLDDLGAQPITDWRAGRLYDLLNDRWLERRTTIVTSNLAPGEDGRLEAAIGERAYSRLVEDVVTIRLGGQDRRRS